MNLYNMSPTFRNLQKNIAFTYIHAAGLSLGMTAFILIAQYVTFEKSYNAFHEKLPTLYRVVTGKEGGVFDTQTALGIAGPGMRWHTFFLTSALRRP
jgi:putative ABC transport system permease protein